LIVACRNETNDRLARVEKKLDQIQQNLPVQTISDPSQTNPVLTSASSTHPPNATPTETAPFVNPPLSQRQIQISTGVAELGVRRGEAAYVARDGNPQFGVVYEDVNKQTVLYKWNPDLKSYVSVCEVEPVLDHEHLVDISPERMAKLQSQLSFVFDPPALPPFTREDLANVPSPPSVHPDLAHTALMQTSWSSAYGMADARTFQPKKIQSAEWSTKIVLARSSVVGMGNTSGFKLSRMSTSSKPRTEK
jgi:hypothetical protein